MRKAKRVVPGSASFEKSKSEMDWSQIPPVKKKSR